MKIIFLYGLPATGKLTIAHELAALTGYKLFHNHLVVDLLLSVFEFGSASFVELRETLWLSVFDHASRSYPRASAKTGGPDGLIFTFAPEKTVRPSFIPRLLDQASRAADEIDFVELTCPLDEIKRRLNAESRHRYGKLTSRALFEQLLAEEAFSMNLPGPKLSIDTSAHTPAQAAQTIVSTLGLRAMR